MHGTKLALYIIAKRDQIALATWPSLEHFHGAPTAVQEDHHHNAELQAAARPKKERNKMEP